MSCDTQPIDLAPPTTADKIIPAGTKVVFVEPVVTVTPVEDPQAKAARPVLQAPGPANRAKRRKHLNARRVTVGMALDEIRVQEAAKEKRRAKKKAVAKQKRRQRG